MPKIDIEGGKVWNDEGNIHRTRPASITVELLADGVVVDTRSVSGSGNRWTYSFTNLPEVDDDGNAITYTVREEPVEGYETTVSGYTITNTLIPRQPSGYVSLSGVKTWNDSDNASGKRPTSITVHLLRDGVVVETRNVTAGTGWSYDFGSLPADDGYGNAYTYELREDGVPGYFNRIDGMNVTNTLIGDGETPPPGETTPNVPTGPEEIPDRRTGTPLPAFEGMTDEELEEMFDLFGYDTPLYGILGTGDAIPAWVWGCACGGILALILAIFLGKRRERVHRT